MEKSETKNYLKSMKVTPYFQGNFYKTIYYIDWFQKNFPTMTDWSNLGKIYKPKITTYPSYLEKFYLFYLHSS